MQIHQPLQYPTTLHGHLHSISQTPAGFAVSEVSGHSPEQVRRVAEALVRQGLVIKAQVGPRRVRYFADAAMAERYRSRSSATTASRPAAGTRMKAGWSADEPAIITSKTRIIRAPAPRTDVFRSNTYLQF